METICPFIQRQTETGKKENTFCLKSRCELWINSNYSTEYLEQGGMCAFKASALKNSDGLIVV